MSLIWNDDLQKLHRLRLHQTNRGTTTPSVVHHGVHARDVRYATTASQEAYLWERL